VPLEDILVGVEGNGGAGDKGLVGGEERVATPGIDVDDISD